MPYIKREKRKELADFRIPLVAGELNYVISKIVDRYIFTMGLSYSTLNDIIGVLECAKLEIYRRIAAPYEDVKRWNNGDVYGHAIGALAAEDKKQEGVVARAKQQLEPFPNTKTATLTGEAKYGETKFG